MDIEKPAEHLNLPVDTSKAGRNRFYFHCEVTERTQHYAVCLGIKDAVDHKRQLSMGPCLEAIGCGDCPAQRLRALEMEAGKALFFVETPNRVINERPQAATSTRIDYQSASYLRGRYGKAAPAPTPAPTPAPASNQGFAQNLNEDLVNLLAYDDAQRALAARGESQPTPLPGEKPIDFARRRAQWMASHANR